MKIAILREAGGLGDVVMTEPAVRGLREKYPRAEIVYVGLPEYECIVEKFSCPPDAYLPVRRQERRDRDGAVNPARWPYLRAVADADLVVDFFCPAFRHEREHRHETYKSRIELFCETAGVEPSTPALFLSDRNREWARGYLSGKGWEGNKETLIALAPWSCGKRRTWPKEKWVELSRRLWESGLTPLSLHAFSEPLARMTGLRVSGLTLDRAAAVLSLCKMAIVNDSGILHLAEALQVQSLSLWGSTNPEVTLAQYPLARFIWKPDSDKKPRRCQAPCYSLRGSCDYQSCREGCRILAEIELADVLRQLTIRPASA
jgi:heptosyltransferase-2